MLRPTLCRVLILSARRGGPFLGPASLRGDGTTLVLASRGVPSDGGYAYSLGSKGAYCSACDPMCRAARERKPLPRALQLRTHSSLTEPQSGDVELGFFSMSWRSSSRSAATGRRASPLLSPEPHRHRPCVLNDVGGDAAAGGGRQCERAAGRAAAALAEQERAALRAGSNEPSRRSLSRCAAMSCTGRYLLADAFPAPGPVASPRRPVDVAGPLFLLGLCFVMDRCVLCVAP